MRSGWRRRSSALTQRRRSADKDIRTSSLSLQPQYRYADNQPPVVTGYQASNQLTVTFRDIKQAGPILDVLVAQGVNQISGPDFSLEHPDSAMDEARVRGNAVRRARKRRSCTPRRRDSRSSGSSRSAEGRRLFATGAAAARW